MSNKKPHHQRLSSGVMDVPKAAVEPNTVPRRAVTAPTAFPQSHSHSSSQSDSAVETLFVHPSVKIVSFSSSRRQGSIGQSASTTADAEEEAGTLSWKSPVERTIAVGKPVARSVE